MVVKIFDSRHSGSKSTILDCYAVINAIEERAIHRLSSHKLVHLNKILTHPECKLKGIAAWCTSSMTIG